MTIPLDRITGTPCALGRCPPTRWALASLSLSMLMPSLDTSIANVGLPTLVEAFGASFQEIQWVVLAYLLATTTLVVGAGRLGDVLGRRRLLLVGIGLFTAASLACGLAPTLPVLVLARGAQGVGAAVMLPLTIALVGETVPAGRTGSAMGLLGTMSAVGTTLGPSLGGMLIALSGWRMIFVVNVPLGLVNLLLAVWTLPADRSARRTDGASFDGAGTLLLGAALGAYALAVTTGHGTFGPVNGALLLAAAAALGLFVVVEARVGSPLLRPEALGDRTLTTGLGMTAIVSTVMMATLVVGPFYLSRGLGLDAAHVGLVMSVGPAVAALTGVPAGRIVDRLGGARMTTLGLLGMVAGLLALSVAPAR
ncbi:MAG TPA: MFS transporter, partial [Myxococcaceae bacterium]